MEQNTQRDPARTIVGRYLVTTLGGVAANLTIYLLLARQAGLWEPIANLAAALTVIGPRFLIHKLWVWRHPSMSRVGREAGVHIGLTAAGLGLSTAAAAVLGSRNASALLLGAGNISAFGVIWLARFYISHVHLFVPHETNEADAEEAKREMEPHGQPPLRRVK